MSVAFRKVSRKIQFGKDAGKVKHFVIARATGKTGIRKLCKMISERSTVSSADVKAVLDSLNYVLDNELQEGRIVQLGELGNFRISITSNGTENEKEATANLVRKSHVIFTPGEALRLTCSEATYEPFAVVKEIVDTTKECNKPHVS